MPELSRRIRHLRLTCAHEEHARHGRVLLEDAMHTAGLGDEGRVVIVRRLHLGRIPLRASATQWSRRLEETYREMRPIPVAIDHPAAARAVAVYFASHHEPWLLLAQRTIAHQACAEWYWRAALPDWTPDMPARETLRLSFRVLVEQGGLALTLLLARRLPGPAALAVLLGCLAPEDFAPLKSSLGFPPPNSTPEVTFPGWPVRPEENLPPEFALARHRGPRDVRTFWLAAVRLAQLSPVSFETAIPSPVSSARVRELVQKWTPQLSATDPAEPSARSAVTQDRPPAPADRTPESDAEKPLPPPNTTPRVAERPPTGAGGLFFLVPLLVRAGLPPFLAELPDDDRRCFPWQLLQLASKHARIEPEDPLVAALEAIPPGIRPLGRWLIATNRHSLRLAAQNLRQLIRRPARMELAPTHIDLFFRSADADLALRRAGLDFDPGWVPWLGRTIRYHFNRED
jgi:hypothetical protein